MIYRLVLWLSVSAPLVVVTALLWLVEGPLGLVVPLGALALGAAAYATQDRWHAQRQRLALAERVAALPAAGDAREDALVERQREVAASWRAISEDAKLSVGERAFSAARQALVATVVAGGALWLVTLLIYWIGLRLNLVLSVMSAAKVLGTLSLGGLLLPLPAVYMAALSLWRREVIQPAQRARALRACAAELDTLATLAGGLTLADHEVDSVLRGALSAEVVQRGQLSQAQVHHEQP